MPTNDQFDNSLKLTKICLLLSGIKVYNFRWHTIIEKLINSFLYYFNMLTLYSVIFGEVYWLADGMQIGRDFVEMSLTAPCITISILSTLKTAPLYYKKDLVYKLIDELKDIYPKAGNYEKIRDSGHKPNENEIVTNAGIKEKNKKQMTEVKIGNESVKILKRIMFVFTLICVSVLITFLLAPLVVINLGYLKTGEMKLIYPFSVKYWFDVYQVQIWPFMYFLQVWGTIIVCVNLFGAETLFYALCTYIEMHFRILCHRFENIQPGSSRITQELVIGVKRHQLLIHLVEQTEALFSLPVLFHIVSSSLLICLSAFNITVAQDFGSLTAFVTFLMLSLSQVSLLCFFGDKLMKSSAEVSGAIYKCPWYEFDVKAKKVVLIILMRAQKPCKLTAANFADLNLRAFTTILSRSWSYFALLKTVYK